MMLSVKQYLKNENFFSSYPKKESGSCRYIILDLFIWKKRFSRDIKNALTNLLKSDRVVIAGPVYLEIIQGTRTEEEKVKSQKRLAAIQWLQVTDEIWRQTAQLAFKLRRKGITVPPIDTLIATIAISHDFRIMHNDKHFRFIAEHSDLKLFDLTPYVQ